MKYALVIILAVFFVIVSAVVRWAFAVADVSPSTLTWVILNVGILALCFSASYMITTGAGILGSLLGPTVAKIIRGFQYNTLGIRWMIVITLVFVVELVPISVVTLIIEHFTGGILSWSIMLHMAVALMFVSAFVGIVFAGMSSLFGSFISQKPLHHRAD